MSPPGDRVRTTASIRQDEKKGRESEGGGAVRVVGEDGFFIARLDRARDAEQLHRILKAPNAEPVRNHAGRLVGIRLLSVGDDRGHVGERHGRSTATTERIYSDSGELIGTHRTLQHKVKVCSHWNDNSGTGLQNTTVSTRSRDVNTGKAADI